MSKYLEELTIRLAMGVGELSEAERQRRAQYFLAAQRDDGGFAGREGESDLYYTSFALRALAVLGELHGEPAERATRFLQTRLDGQAPIIDFLSLIYSAALIDSAAGFDVYEHAADGWQEAVARSLENLRRPDGGFAKTEQGMASSTYHTFLVVLCLELIEQPLQRPDEVVRFLLSQRAEDGGFREIRASKRAGANPTAAAIGGLRTLDALTDDIREETIDFLLEMQTSDGGFRANTRIPLADLLSTFTAVLTLQDLGVGDEFDRAETLQFVENLSNPNGGFRGVEIDPADDVEYSFYGVGSLGLLHLPADPGDPAHGASSAP